MRILLIEDNKDLCDSICYHLQNEGYTTDTCLSGEDALFYALKQSYDLIILDRMLPVMDGLTILKKIRSNNINVPVIMVTAMDGLHDRIDGLDSGADDYIVKPFAVEELLARIRAIARRPQKIEQLLLIKFSNLELDVKTLTIKSDRNSCTLSKREADLMEYLMRNSNQTLTREILLSHVWGPDNFVEDGNLDNYIHFLRRRLKSIQGFAKIRTIYKVGYRLEEAGGDK